MYKVEAANADSRDDADNSAPDLNRPSSSSGIEKPLFIFSKGSVIPGTDKPQLRCIGGTAQGSDYEPQTVFCVPPSNRNKEWECEGRLGPFVKFGSTNVHCYPFGGDGTAKPHKCFLEYSLDFIEHDVMAEGALTGSFLTIVLGVAIIFFVFRQRRPSARDRDRGDVGNRDVNRNRERDREDGRPVNPALLRGLAYGIIGIVSAASATFLAIVAYMLV
jgi:hypothetical protein